jgi:hypothetical protein
MLDKGEQSQPIPVLIIQLTILTLFISQPSETDPSTIKKRTGDITIRSIKFSAETGVLKSDDVTDKERKPQGV